MEIASQNTDLSAALRAEVPAVTPNNPPWNAPIALLVWGMSVLFIMVVPLLFVLPYIATQQIAFTDNAQLLEFFTRDPTVLLLQVIAIVPAHLLTLVLAWLVVTRLRQYSFRQTLGWAPGGMQWWHYVVTLGLFFAIATMASAVYPEQDNELLRLLRSSRAAVFMVAFMATFTAPLVEEVIYRGLLYSAFQRTLGVAPAVMLVTALFAAVHIPQYWPSYTTIFLLSLLSLTLTLIRYKTGNLLPCVIFHTIFNGLQSAFLIAEPYFDTQIATPDPLGILLQVK